MKKNYTPLFYSIIFISLNSCTVGGTGLGDPAGNWINRSILMGSSRSEAASFVIGGNAYVCTGYSSSQNARLNDCWQYSAKDDSWTQKADFPGAPRNSAVGFTIENNGYIATGYDGNQLVKDLWKYNAVANEWTRKQDFPGIARKDAVGFGILYAGYIATGNDGFNDLKDIWRYEPATEKWTREPDLNGTQRSEAIAVVYRDKAYLVTGRHADNAVNDCWYFDPMLPRSESWKRIGSIANTTPENFDDGYTNISRWNAVGLVILGTLTGDKLFIVTGTNSYNNGSFTWEYDFATDLWKEKNSFEGTSRTGAVGFSADNRGFVVSGMGTMSNDLNDTFEFHPDEVKNPND